MKNIPGMAIAVVAALTVSVGAEVIRPTLTLENRFPEPGGLEFSAAATFLEYTDESEQSVLNDANAWVVTPGARYMATENLALLLDVPFGGFDPDLGDSESGIGDVGIGLQLRAYEDLFRFPYVIPHARFQFDTGDDKVVGLGDGQHSAVLGVTIGSQVYDVPIFANFDVQYELFEDTENIFRLSGSFVWELSDQFAMLAEARISDEEQAGFLPEQEHPVLFGGGMIYEPNERTTVSFYGAGAKNAKEDVIATVRMTYDL